MEKKICKICGKPFKAFKPEFDTCPDCKKGNQPSTGGGGKMPINQSRGYHAGGGEGQHPFRGQTLPSKLKIQDGFFDSSGNIKGEIYGDISREIAGIFNETRMNPSSVRPFFEAVRVTYENYLRDPDRSFQRAMESLNRLRPIVHYKEKRSITQHCFTDFMEHYIQLTSKDPQNLRGFKELFMSVIGYMKK